MPSSSKRTVAVVQSNYIPWRGYFDLMRSVDEFIIFDSVQYTRRDWRNRNIIKTSQGPRWITIPVEAAGRYLQAIDETRVAGPAWAEQHIKSIELNYRKADAFSEVGPWLFTLLRELAHEPLLTRLNEKLLREIAQFLEIRSRLRRDTDLLDRRDLAGMDASARLVALCKAAGADRYLSGPTAREYLDESPFRAANIEVAWMDYSGYPQYPQLWGPFDPHVSIVDLLLNVGRRAPAFLNRDRTTGVEMPT
jgi:WbqC-like protein family